MTRTEKIQDILENWQRGYERKYAAEYLWALYRNKEDVVAEYEKYGRTPRHIFMNKYSYECALKFGFTDFVIDKNGWLEMPEWLNVEEIEFRLKSDNVCMNSIKVGMSPNNKWTVGVTYDYGDGGGYWGLSVFGDAHNSRNEAIYWGIDQLINKHVKAFCDRNMSSKSLQIVKMAKNFLQELLNPKPVQINLFDL